MRKIIFSFIFMLAVTPAFALDFSINEPNIEVTAAMQAQSRAQAVAHSQVLLHDTKDVVAGNPNGKVTLVQFLDFLCPLSEKMDPSIQALIKANPELRIVYKPYPMHGKVSRDAMEASISAYQQGKYPEYHTELMKDGGNLTDEKIIQRAQGLNQALIKKAMATDQYAAQIDAALKLAKTLGVPGTPALFFIKTNTTNASNPDDVIFMLGSFPQEDLQSAIDKVAAND